MNPWLILILAVILAFGAWRRSQAMDVLKPLPPDEVDNRTQLRRSLGELIDFLARHGQPDWAARLREVHGDLLVPTTEPAALQRLGDFFGGMGSLNDVGFTDAELGRQLDRLLDAVFRDLTLYHGVPAHRQGWAELERQHQGEPPPRIKHAFRGPASQG